MSRELMAMGQGPLMMTSREIADLTDKRHSDVMRDIRVMMAALEQNADLRSVCISNTYVGENEQTYPQYELDKDTSLNLLLGYDAVARMKVIKRWQELEAGQGQKLPQSFAQALRLAAEQAEQIEQLAYERDEAKRTKAEIGSRREATAMATAAAKTKEVAKLQHELGRNQQHATVIAVENATKQKFAKNAYVGLRKAAKEFGLGAVDVVDQRYGSVKAWPAAAWRKCFGIELGDLFPGGEAA